MILGSIGSGILLGLTGALMVWLGGHPLPAILFAYSILGSLGTLLVACLASLRAPLIGRHYR